ncbi:MAG: membrane protein insertase YidC [Candidatus Kerfeldbacteria bacterium]|nr:membrane protein insertase YidC [Candidatus Kerfeldbacteria bacterium]
MNVFTTFIYQPIFNALLFIHKTLPGGDLGLAIIVITALIKLILYSPSLAAIRASRQLAGLQPQLKELQERYKNDRSRLAEEQMKLYRQSKVNPLSSCLPALVQIPILYALFLVFFKGLQVDSQGLIVGEQLQLIYSGWREYYATTPLNATFLNFVDLAKNHNLVLSVLAGATQFWQTKMLVAPKEPKVPGAKDEALTSTMNRQMTYIFPAVTVYIAYTFPAGLALYWTASTLFTVGQQYLFLRRHPLRPAPSPPDHEPTA